MQDLIMAGYDKCKDKGYTTRYEREHFKRIYEEYKNSGGNSFIEEIEKDFNKISKKEE